MMSSRESSSSSRTTVVSLRQQDAGAPPATPSKDEEGTSQSPAPADCDTTTPPTLQQRRGRRRITNSTLRPLSVFTKSMLIPFDQNFEKAFDVLESDSPDRLKLAQSILCPEEQQDPETDKPVSQQVSSPETSPERPGDDNKQSQPRVQTTGTEAGTPHRLLSNANMLRQKPARDFDMDLITALKSTSPEKDSAARITGDFATLCELPVPDPSEHPTLATNPFEAKTQAPLLFTSTTAKDIRAYKSRGYSSVDHHSERSGRSIERKISLFSLGLNLSTPSSAKSRNAFSPCADLPFPALVSSSYAGSNSTLTKEISSTVTETPSARDSVNNDRGGGVRNFSGLFKRRNTSERSDPGSPACSPRPSVENPNLIRQDLVSFEIADYKFLANKTKGTISSSDHLHANIRLRSLQSISSSP